MDSIICIKKVDEDNEYGVFAKKIIRKNTIIG
jgi:hypothetical protein